MDLLKIVWLSLGSLLTLFILTKLMGNKEMSQLSMFDYIIGITIGSIIISFVSYKSLKLNRFLTGPSLILLDNGEIYRKNLKKAKLDITEFLMQCRTSGYFNLSDIQTAILEPNGKISFLPKAEKRPINPSDMNISVPVDKVVVNVILDGIVLKENLYHTGNDELWLEKQLVSQGIQNVNDIYLATCDCNNNLSIYLKKDLENKHDFFD